MNKYDVVIIGGGISGLMAAYGLVNRNNGFKIAIIDKGKMIAHDNTLGTIEENVEDYLTEEKKWDLERELSDLISKVKSG